MNEAQSNNERKKLLQQVVLKAETLQKESTTKTQSPFLKRLQPILSNLNTKFFLIKLLDTALRPSEPKAINKHIQTLFKNFPNHAVLFSPFERTLVFLYKHVGKLVPSISIPLLVKRIKSITNDVIFDIQETNFNKNIKKRKNADIKQNINLIGEALLGEEEAARRIQAYKELINHPEIDYISVKISTLYSQISSLAHEETLKVLKDKLSVLYNESILVASATGKKTFINLDMEEFRDLSLTVDLFQSLLSERQYKQLYAGIVLQAYIPDSFKYLKGLQEWSQARVKEGGSPVKVRIVKGANLEMEKHESSLKGWPQAPHNSKVLVDAQFKKMLLATLTKKSCHSLRIGIASHNIFDISFAVCLIKNQQLHNFVDFEMLEGLAESFLVPLKNQGLHLLLYTPVIKSNEFLSAIAYLVRRFDEATAKGNYLRESVGMSLHDENWKGLYNAFELSYEEIIKLDTTSNKIQNRLNQKFDAQTVFENSIDTDWNIVSNRKWAQSISLKWQSKNTVIPKKIPDYDIKRKRETLRVTNWEGELPWLYELADLKDYEEAIEGAKRSSWNRFTAKKRIKILKDVGRKLEEKRGDLIGVGMAEVGKLITEMDPEISEAIDFANYYGQSLDQIQNIPDLTSSTSGTSLVLSPWNFPIAIPAGGILASLAIGNTVILKPASKSIACAYLLVKTMHEAGVPKDALYLLPTRSKEIQPLLTPKSAFSSVILTGGTETAKTLLNQNPDLNLYAETGGKNATIVTAFADKELAIKNIIASAFNNTGQKCSATSLLILEKQVATPQFYQLLQDAVKSKKVGSPWEFDSKIGPLVNPINGKLEDELLKENNWLLKGKIKGSHFVTPFIAKNVTENSSCFKNELFGPHLSILEVNDLHEAVELANKVSFGLTSGIESLNKKEIEYWKSNIQSGNLYINRSTTGAIVKRQPFGGVKLSSFGPGMKAGGKNYLLQFLDHAMNTALEDSFLYAQKSFQYWKDELFDKELDEIKIRGQANTSKYLKPDQVLILISTDILSKNLNLVKLACKTLDINYTVFSTSEILEMKDEQHVIINNWQEITKTLNWNTRIRSLTNFLPQEFKRLIKTNGHHIYEREPIPHGRIELLNYLQEQSISYNYHRYGNLMGKEMG